MRLIEKFKKKYFSFKNRNFKIWTDELIFQYGYFFVSGWAFNVKNKYNSAFIVFETKNEIKKFEVNLNERIDVYNTFNNENSLNSGFTFSAAFSLNSDVRVYIEFIYDGGKDVYIFGNVTTVNYDMKDNVFWVSKIVSGYCDYNEFNENFSNMPVDIPQSLYEKEIDIIIPIYNGFDYLENLFKTVSKTKMKYRLILINDCSTDSRVFPYVCDFAKDKDNVILINNERNLGFVQSVNKALVVSDKDVALVNTDVILPDMWLERLMLPIILKSDVATSTPFTNSGTICSFPNFCEDNKIFLDLDVNDIDKVFRTFKPVYNSMPTGVGFCMGMKREAINRVGILDAETFYKGYGEENDWCQRAISLGYKNVHVENLFVYHKHGASFPSEEKKRYIERNLKLLNEMHPNYDRDVQIYLKADPARCYREYAKFKIMSAFNNENVIVIDHDWGGGANSYCNTRVKTEIETGFNVIKLIQGKTDGLYAEYIYKDFKAGFGFKNISKFTDFINNFSISKIIVNEIVSFENPYEIMDYILELKRKTSSSLIMLGHDFYSLCPSLYLIDSENKHCFKPDMSACEVCIMKNKNVFNTKFGNIKKWREAWKNFLSSCDEITVFSENSKSYFLHWYPDLKNITVNPHKVDYIQKIEDYPKDKKRIKIGILGNFMKTKGSEIIIQMAEIIKNNSEPIDIIIIGQNLENEIDKSLGITITGKYNIKDIPQIMRDNKIDIVFIASIWPETFSYTTEEVIKMGLFAASFNIGAPAERIALYEKGLVISEMNAKTALNEIKNFIKK